MNQYPDDPYHLERFLEAQSPVYDQVCRELQQGLKMTHWMWLIFPQMEGLSSSTMSKTFAISSLEEATAYLNHPVLGARLKQCTELVINTSGRTLKQILGPTDNLKFRSSMTLFTHAATENEVFETALTKYFSGGYDQLTLDRLGTSLTRKRRPINPPQGRTDGRRVEACGRWLIICRIKLN